MSIHVYDPACPATSQAFCTCPTLTALVPDSAANFQARLLRCARSPPAPDQVPSVVYLPGDLKRPVNELEYRAYLKVHKLEAPLSNNLSVQMTLPFDLTSFETRWQTRISQRRPAARWPAICTVCNKGPSSRHALLCCHDCGLSTHASCRGPAVDRNKFTNQFYSCESCTFCNLCSRKDNQHLTKICDTCTGTWHVYCLQLPYSRIQPLLQQPSRYFRCKRCSNASAGSPTDHAVVEISTVHPSVNGNGGTFKEADVELDSDDTVDQDETSSDEG